MKARKIVIGMVLLAVVILSFPLQGLAQQREEGKQRTGKLMVGIYPGLHAGTPDDTIFGLGFNADYYLDENLSLGPLLQFGFGDDAFQVGASGQARYVFHNPRLQKVKPHLQGGLGFLYVDVDAPGLGDDDDMGFWVPFGGGFDVELDRNILLGTTLLLNYTDAEVPGQSSVFMTWFFGLRGLL